MSFASYTIGNLEAEVRDLKEKNTILKGERDEFERQRDEVMDAMTAALNGWQSALDSIGDVDQARYDEINEMRRKYVKA
jgi:FtsZ-binding cell division protein ZapB